MVWSTRINVDTTNEKEEFVYTILTRTVSLLIIVVFPTIQQDYINIIKQFVESRLIRWDDESETAYQQLKNSNDQRNNDEDEDNSEDNPNPEDDNIDPLFT